MAASLAIGLAAIVAIVAWNAFFVAAEYAFVGMRRSRLVELADGGNARARRVMAIVDDPSRFLAAVQVAITLSSLALGAVAHATLAAWVEDALGSLEDALARGLIAALALVIAFAVVAALHVVFGEIVPKTFSLVDPERVALAVVGPVVLFMRLLGPFVWLLRELAQGVTRVLGLPRPSEMRLAHSEEELKLLVSASREEGVLEPAEQEMLYKVFDFSETEAQEVMVPRPDVVALPVDLTPREALARVLDHPHTRYPAYGEDLDDIQGVLHLRRLIDALENGGANARDLRALLRPAYFVPETKRLGRLLEELRRTNTHLAVVVDEYGSTAGIVTLEDLLEEIVGDIADEFDLPDVSILRLAGGGVRVAGSFPIVEFNERFGTHLDAEHYNSLGGFLFGALGRAPEAGDVVEDDGSRFVVHEVDGPRIRTIDVTLRDREGGAAPADV